MENNSKKPAPIINISDETQIDRPVSREMFPVEKIDWERLKRLIRGIDVSSSRWERAGWFMLPTTIAFFIATSTSSEYRMYFLIADISSLILTFILFFVALRFSKISRDSKKDLLEEMKQMEDKTVSKEQL